MKIWVFNSAIDYNTGKADQIYVDFVYKYAKKGESRFGWSYLEDTDLLRIDELEDEVLSEDELFCYYQGVRLLEIEKGDWIVHQNTPKQNYCCASKVIGTYKLDSNKTVIGTKKTHSDEAYTEYGDFRHVIRTDATKFVEFHRENDIEHHGVTKGLKGRGRIRVFTSYKDEFLEIIKKKLKDKNKAQTSKPSTFEVTIIRKNRRNLVKQFSTQEKADNYRKENMDNSSTYEVYDVDNDELVGCQEESYDDIIDLGYDLMYPNGMPED